MDYIRKYDIELEREHYYAGEKLRGWVIIENIENLRITGVQVYLRGKAHVEWRITRAGERRTVKEDQYFIDSKAIVWGKDSSGTTSQGDEGSISIMPRGEHRLPFEFHLPEECLPCSFESRIGTVRYYLRVIIDIPYSSPPQGLKYFTVVGPIVDCLDERYLSAMSTLKQTSNHCLCCTTGPVSLEVLLDRSAYCCGEQIKLKCDVQNGSSQTVSLLCRLIQNVEYRINKGALGLSKDVSHQVLEFQGPPVLPHTNHNFYDLHKNLQIPVMPPTMIDACKVIEIYYVLKVSLMFEKSGEDLHVEYPLIIVTIPHSTISNQSAELSYEPANDRVEGGIYISPEFQLGQVYDGAADVTEDVILYRPVYVCLLRHNSNNDVVTNGHSPLRQTRGAQGGQSPLRQPKGEQDNAHSTPVASLRSSDADLRPVSSCAVASSDEKNSTKDESNSASSSAAARKTSRAIRSPDRHPTDEDSQCLIVAEELLVDLVTPEIQIDLPLKEIAELKELEKSVPSKTMENEMCIPKVATEKEKCIPSKTIEKEKCTPSKTIEKEKCTPSKTTEKETCTPSKTTEKEKCTSPKGKEKEECVSPTKRLAPSSVPLISDTDDLASGSELVLK